MPRDKIRSTQTVSERRVERETSIDANFEHTYVWNTVNLSVAAKSYDKLANEVRRAISDWKGIEVAKEYEYKRQICDQNDSRIFDHRSGK